MPEVAHRRAYLDWLRGLAVLVMIEAHVIDAWTRVTDRASQAYDYSIMLGGFAAPLFLFLAGLAAVLSLESKRRRTRDPAGATTAVCRRGLEIFGLALLFRLQAYVVSWGAWRDLLKVDILNIMGPAIVAVAVIWHIARTRAARLVAFAVVATAIAMVTPVIRTATWVAPLPDPLEWYLRPVPGWSSFCFFPWSAFLPAGAAAGLLIDSAREDRQERRLLSALAVGGTALALAGYGASFLPTIYAASEYWTTSPAFFALRVGVLTALIPVAWLWVRALPPRGEVPRRLRLEELGRSSLFVYWIHVEVAYGLVSYPLHKSLPLGAAWVGLALLALLMYRLVLLKGRLVERRRAGRSGAALTSNRPNPVFG
jgi:uncharacterized membrane protein